VHTFYAYGCSSSFGLTAVPTLLNAAVPIAIRNRAIVPGQGRQAEKPREQEKPVSDNGQVHEAKDGAFMRK